MRKLIEHFKSNNATIMVVPVDNKPMKKIRFNFIVLTVILLTLIGINIYLIINTWYTNSVSDALERTNDLISTDLLKERDRIKSLENIAESACAEIKELKSKLGQTSDLVEQRLIEIENAENQLSELISLFNEQTNSNLDIPTSRSFNRGTLFSEEYNQKFEDVQTNVLMSAKALSASHEISQILEEKTTAVSELKTKLTDQLEYLSARPDYYPTNGIQTSPFGMRLDPFTGVNVLHTGLDISNSIGTEIYSAGDGVVIAAEYKMGYGNVVMISHGYGYITVYAHCDSLEVEEGQSVKKGDLVAYMGSTGKSTGPHLHFEIRYDSSPIDPLTIINY